jgi:prepilin-type N-terminal cleavage/methylation domain-containing protein
VIRTRARRRRRGGFTMVELMIALLISSLLVGMTLSIFSRMSLAFRTQENVAELQQVLAATHDMIARDVRQAGFGIPDGFFFANDQYLYAPLEVTNNANGFGPDLIKIFYADPSAQARVTVLGDTQATVDSVDEFEGGDVVVFVGYDGGVAGSKIFTACVLQLDSVTGNTPATLVFDQAGVYGSATADQCDGIRANIAND